MDDEERLRYSSRPSSPRLYPNFNLRQSLRESFERAGIPDEMRTHLRSRIIRHLSGLGEITFPAIRAESVHSVVHTISNVLIADYFRAHHLDYTLSVFLPESGLSQPPHIDTFDIIELLRLDSKCTNSSTTRLIESLTQERPASFCRKSFLESLLIGVRALCASYNSQFTQTQSVREVTNELKRLQETLDHERMLRRQEIEQTKKRNDLLMEERVERSLSTKITEFRAQETKRIQAQAREEYNTRLEIARLELEAKFEKKELSLKDELDLLKRQTTKRERELEASYSSQKAELEVQRRALFLDKERHSGTESVVHDELLKKTNEELVSQVESLRTKLIECEFEYQQQLKNLQHDHSLQKSELLHQVKLQQMRLEAERSSMEKLNQISLRRSDSIGKITAARHQSEESQHTITHLRQEIINLKSDLAVGERNLLELKNISGREKEALDSKLRNSVRECKRLLDEKNQLQNLLSKLSFAACSTQKVDKKPTSQQKPKSTHFSESIPESKQIMPLPTRTLDESKSSKHGPSREFKFDPAPKISNQEYSSTDSNSRDMAMIYLEDTELDISRFLKKNESDKNFTEEAIVKYAKTSTGKSGGNAHLSEKNSSYSSPKIILSTQKLAEETTRLSQNILTSTRSQLLESRETIIRGSQSRDSILKGNQSKELTTLLDQSRDLQQRRAQSSVSWLDSPSVSPGKETSIPLLKTISSETPQKSKQTFNNSVDQDQLSFGQAIKPGNKSLSSTPSPISMTSPQPLPNPALPIPDPHYEIDFELPEEDIHMESSSSREHKDGEIEEEISDFGAGDTNRHFA